jgi:drug/metabolite transporter (DMT)-like permease
MVGGMACFGSATPVSQIVGRSFPVWLGSGLRIAIAAVVLLPPVVLAARRRNDGTIAAAVHTRGTDRWLLVGLGVVGTFGFSALMLLGMRRAPGSVGAVVMATTPAVTAIGAVVFLRDHLGFGRAVAIAMALAGVVLVNVGSDAARGSGSEILLGSVLVFGAVACEACYSLMGKRLTAQLSPLTVTMAAAIIAVVAFAPLAIWDALSFTWSSPSAGEWLALVWWGAGTMGLGSWLWFQGMARVEAGTASAFMAVMPVSALLLSYVLLGEAFEWIQIAGMAIVLAGLALVTRSGAARALSSRLPPRTNGRPAHPRRATRSASRTPGAQPA